MSAHALTLARLALLAPLVYLLAAGGNFHQWAALVVYAAVCAGGLLDKELARRHGGMSPSHAMLDRLCGRLLVVAVVAGLIAAGERGALVFVASLVLIARNTVIAALGEALQGRFPIPEGPLEQSQSVLQFLGFSFLIAPSVPLPDAGVESHVVGAWALIVAALLAVTALAIYGRRAAEGFRS